MDPYAVLGLSPSASDQEVADAYRRLARKYHPDLNPGNSAAEERMKEINAAYQLIEDRRSGKQSAPNNHQASGNPYGYAGANEPPYGNPYGYPPFGAPYGQYRVYRVRRARPFSLFRFFLTLLLLSFFMRACSLMLFSLPAERPEDPRDQYSEPQNTPPEGESRI